MNDRVEETAVILGARTANWEKNAFDLIEENLRSRSNGRNVDIPSDILRNNISFDVLGGDSLTLLRVYDINENSKPFDVIHLSKSNFFREIRYDELNRSAKERLQHVIKNKLSFDTLIDMNKEYYEDQRNCYLEKASNMTIPTMPIRKEMKKMIINEILKTITQNSELPSSAKLGTMVWKEKTIRPLTRSRIKRGKFYQI